MTATYLTPTSDVVGASVRVSLDVIRELPIRMPHTNADRHDRCA